MPIAYHGRAGTVVVSGTPVRRPTADDAPRTGRSGVRRLASARHRSRGWVCRWFTVATRQACARGGVQRSRFRRRAGQRLVGRDLQAWESVPLGPFLGKSFATSISPWVVPSTRCGRPASRSGRSPRGVPYLHDIESWCLDLTLEVRLNGSLISRPPFATQYWSPGQQLAHLTVNGASLRTGDLFASGTVTGPEPDERGSLLELSWGGREPSRWTTAANARS